MEAIRCRLPWPGAEGGSNVHKVLEVCTDKQEGVAEEELEAANYEGNRLPTYRTSRGAYIQIGLSHVEEEVHLLQHHKGRMCGVGECNNSEGAITPDAANPRD